MNRMILAFLGALLCFGHAPSAMSASTDSTAPSPLMIFCWNWNAEQHSTLRQFIWRNNDPDLRPDFCDPKDLANHVARAILLVKAAGNLSFSSASNSKQGLLPPNPFEFFSKRIQTIQFEPDGGDCNGFTGAYVKVSGSNQPVDGIMHVCRQLAREDDLSVSGTLIHEARHEDGYDHTTCNHGFYTGSANPACDESYSVGGSYAIETEYLVKMTRSQSLKPSMQQNARAAAIQLLVERFNKLPLGIKKGAVLVGDDYKVQFYDGSTATPFRPLANKNERLYHYAGLLKVYDPAKKTLTTLPDGVNASQVIENFEYKGDDAGQFVDSYANSMTTCDLFTHGVNCNFSGKEVSLPIYDFTPTGFWTYAPIDSSNDLVEIMSKEGQTYILRSDSQTFERVRSTSKNGGNWNSQSFISLGFDGKISFIDKKTGQSNPDTPGLNPSDTFQKMITPYYWSKILQKI